MANDVYNNKSGSSLQDAYARLNEAIKQRNASLNGQQYDTTNGVALNTTPVGVNGQQQAQAQGSDANAIWRTIGTIDEALRNVGRGFLKLGEGVVDAHLAIGGIFDKDWAENVIKYDAVNAMMEWESNNFSLNSLYKQKTGSNLYDESWLNDANEKVQNIVQGVEQGIGNALGFLSFSGAGGVGIGLQWSGSGGMVLEEQFNDPDYNGNYFGAWGKGFIMGGVETGLEHLLGWSPKKMGVSAKTFKTVLKDLGKDFVEEGFEEVASDLISPLLEGMDSTKSIGEAYKESFENLGETFIVGGLTGALMSGAGEISSTIYLSPEGQKIAYEISENNEYYQQAYENFKNNPNEQQAYDDFIKARDEVATNLKALGERVGKLASKYQNRLGTTATINGQKVQLPMTKEVLDSHADITSQANPVVMAVQETIDLMNNSNIKGIDNMKVEFVTEGSEAYKKAFKTDAKGINGAYDKNTNTFYLNTNSAKAFKFVTGHEITHLMEENNAYEDVYDEILDSLEQSGEYDKLYEKTSKLYEDQIKGMSKEQAREYINQEIVADYFGENFKNFSEIQKLFTKQTHWEKFIDIIKSVRKSNRSSKAKEYYQRFLKQAVNTKIVEKKQPAKAVAYSKREEQLKKEFKKKIATIAPYYNTQVTNDNFETVKNKIQNDFHKKAQAIASMLNINIDNVNTNIGGFTFQEGENAGQMVKELSYTYELGNCTDETADLFACLMGELGHEQQEAVISANYLESNSTDEDGIEFSITVKDVNGVDELLKKNGINDYTINLTGKEIKISVWKNGDGSFDGIDELTEKIKNFTSELGGNLNERKYQKVASRYLDKDARGKVYEKWIAKSNLQQQKGELYSYITEAYDKLKQSKEIKFSKSYRVDSQGNDLTQQQWRFFKDSKVVDKNGNLLVVYHGTTWEFFTFEKDKASPESDMGRGFYFTNKKKDATLNYADAEKSPDLKNKIERLAEQIENTDEISYEEALIKAKELLVGNKGNVMEVYLDIKNPAYNDTIIFSFEKFREDYDSYDLDDFDGDEDEFFNQIYQDYFNWLVEEVQYELERKVDLDDYSRRYLDDLITDIGDKDVTLDELKEIAMQYEFTNENGEFVSNDVVNTILRVLGYDGIIDSKVSKKFNMNLDTDTTHYIVFNSNQIKLTSNKAPTKNNDVRLSKTLDNEGNKLSQQQARFFENSQIKNNQGQLKVLYRGVTFAGDMDLKSNKRNYIFLTDSLDVASSYTGNKNLVDTRKFNTVDEVYEYFYGEYNNDFVLNLVEFSELEEMGIDTTKFNKKQGHYLVKNNKVVKEFANDNELMQNLIPYLIKLTNKNSNNEKSKQTIYKVYANITKPLIVDAKGNGWDNIYFNNKKMTTDEIAEFAYQNGYDGVEIKNVIDYGTNKQTKPASTIIAFESNQVKATDNYNPTYNLDIRFSKNEKIEWSEEESTDGDTLSKQQARFFKNCKFREDGQLLTLYHGTNNGGFMTFNSESGVYFFTPEYDVAVSYADEIEEPRLVDTSYKGLIRPNIDTEDYYNSAYELVTWFNKIKKEFTNDKFFNYELLTPEDDVEDNGVNKWQDAIKKHIDKRVSKLKELNAPEFMIKDETLRKYKNAFVLTSKTGVDVFIDHNEFVDYFIDTLLESDSKFEEMWDSSSSGNKEAIYKVYVNVTNPLIINCRGSDFMNVLFRGKRMRTDDIAVMVKEEGIYDGIIFKNIMDNGAGDFFNAIGTTDVYVAFEPNQIKAVDNYNPTSNPDIRYSKSGTTINQPKQKLVAQLKDGKVYDIVDGQVVIDLFTKQLKTNDDQIIITPNRDKLLEKINLLLNLEKVGTKEFNSKLEDLAKEIVNSAKVSVETSKVDPKTNKKIREYISLNQYLGLTKQEVTDYLIPRFIEEVNRVAVVNGKKSLVTIYKEKSQQKVDALKQTYIDFINDLNTTIKNLSKEIKSIKTLENNSKSAMLKIANIKYWAKTNFDSKATYKADTIEAKFAQSAKVIAKLKFKPDTAQLDKSYGAVIQKLFEFYFDNDPNALVNTLKLEDSTAREYIDEALNYFNARYSDKALQTSPLETNKKIDDANYPRISGKTETQVYADILGEMRRIINKANNIVYGELGGQRVLVKDAVKPEIAFQESIDRKVANNLFTNGATNYVMSLIDTKAYLTIMAHGDSNSLIMKIYQQLFEGQKETYRIEQDLLSGLNTFLQDKNNKKLVKRLKQSKYNIKFCNVEMTLGEAIGLYMMMGTDNAPSHLSGKGVTFETKILKQVREITGKDFYEFASQKIKGEIAMINSIKKVKKGQKYTKKQLAYLKKKFNATNKTNADLDGRLAELNKETIKIAREELKKLIGNDYDGLISRLEELYSKSGKYYTEASRKMFGFSFEPKKYYYPTRSSKEELKDIDALTSYVSNSLNPSFTKKADGGTNALFVGDVVDTALSFTNTLSKYCGVTVEIKNVRKFLNAEVDGKSINKILKNNVDLKFTERMNDLFKEMQGIKVAPKSFIEKAIKKFRSFASKSALGLNLKTAITQYTSYPKAFMFIKGDNLFLKAFKGKKARTKDGLVDFDYAMNNSPYIANRYKNGNVYNIEAVGAIEKIDTFTDLTMKPLEFTDKQVLKRIWYACQYECMDANGKVDLNKAMALFEQVVSDTQAQYDALGNGSITRTNSEFMKGSLMYSAENRKTLSRLVEAFYMFAITKKNPAQHKKASNYLAKVSVGFLAQSTMVIAISTLLKYLKGDYDDEEAEEIVLGIVKDELAMNIIGMFPVIKDFYSYLVQGYDYKVSGISQMYEFLSVLNDIPTMLDIEANDGERRKAFFQAVTKISHFFGIPVKNVFNDILYPLGIVDKTLNTSMVMKMKNFYYNTSNANLNTYLKNYSKKGKEKQVSATIQMKFKNYISGDIDDVSADELARLYMNGSLETFPTQLSNSVYVDGVEYTLNKAQKSHAQAIYDIANDLLLDLIKSYSYSVLTDDEKVKAIKKLYDTYYELIKGSVVSDYNGTKLSQVANYVDVVKYSSILSKISSLKETNNQTRKVVVQNYINKQKLSSNEKYLLYYLAGYSLDDEKKKLVQNYLKTQGMSYAQSKEFVQPAQK